MQLKSIFYLFIIILIVSCKSNFATPKESFEETNRKSSIVSYDLLENWAAHPDKDDPSDLNPRTNSITNSKNLKADVFFIYPTSFLGKTKDDTYWNAKIDDTDLNKKTDNSSIKLQASIFNAAGRVYAPRYRQAHIRAYYSTDTISNKKALDFAYQDVKKAFEYYVKNLQKDRPFIIASHSQGTTHVKRLVKELVDGKPIQKKLIAAYLIGMPIQKNEFKAISPCEDKSEIGCSISWRTYNKKIEINKVKLDPNILVTNPLSWKTTKDYVSKDKNKGGILLDLNKIHVNFTDAQVKDGILIASKPKFFGSFLINTKNYHMGDLNFYYMNVRENATHRVNEFLKL